MADELVIRESVIRKHIGRQMIAQRSGSIIASSTVDALVGCTGVASFTAVKCGVTSMVRSFAARAGRDGVRVNAIVGVASDHGSGPTRPDAR